MAMTSALYLGIDGGQSHTEAVVADANGLVLGRGFGGPSNHVEAPGGRERLRNAIADSTSAALRGAGADGPDDTIFAAAYCAMTGEADFKQEIIASVVRATVLRVDHDAPAALAGATVGTAGIIVIAGTGSVVYGESDDGRHARTGGWGYVFGDDGGGFGLAREAVRASLDALDGVGPETSLTATLTRRFGVADLRLLPMHMYNGHVSRDGVADAARDVLAAWQHGDAIAACVVERGLESLAARAESVAARLAMSAPLVCMAGGLFRMDAYREAFADAMRRRVPDAHISLSRLSPAEGAVLLAYRAGGVAITEALRARLQASHVAAGLVRRSGVSSNHA